MLYFHYTKKPSENKPLYENAIKKNRCLFSKRCFHLLFIKSVIIKKKLGGLYEIISESI